MSGHDSPPRYIQDLLKINPDMEVKRGTKHWQIFNKGDYICILPDKLAREGFNKTTKSNFKRAGMILNKSQRGKQ